LEAVEVQLDRRGNVQIDARNMTTVAGLFCAGDMQRGQSLVVHAINDGRRAAHYIDGFLMGRSNLPLL
jgi:glutamate synthase (NADPH) small chain